MDAVAALTWDIPTGPATARLPYEVKPLQPPVPMPRPDHGPIKAVALGVIALVAALGLGALAGRALRRR